MPRRLVQVLDPPGRRERTTCIHHGGNADHLCRCSAPGRHRRQFQRHYRSTENRRHRSAAVMNLDDQWTGMDEALDRKTLTVRYIFRQRKSPLLRGTFRHLSYQLFRIRFQADSTTTQCIVSFSLPGGAPDKRAPKNIVAYITIAIRLRYDYNTTTTKNWHAHFLLASNRVEWKQARAIRRSRILVESQL